MSVWEGRILAVGEGMTVALEQYGCYTRQEVFVIFGCQTADKKMQGGVAGVLKIDFPYERCRAYQAHL